MTRVPIPEASLQRLRAAYSQFEQLSTLVAEAMGIDPLAVKGVDMPGGAFILKDDETVTVHANGVVEAST